LTRRAPCLAPGRAHEILARLEPPGFLALHYGGRTPFAVLHVYVAYGLILGSFYRLPA
jgi:hypothetical protein